jgi:hypothetical protein
MLLVADPNTHTVESFDSYREYAKGILGGGSVGADQAEVGLSLAEETDRYVKGLRAAADSSVDRGVHTVNNELAAICITTKVTRRSIREDWQAVKPWREGQEEGARSQKVKGSQKGSAEGYAR